MRRTIRAVLVPVPAVAALIAAAGCGDDKPTPVTKLDQPIPKVASSGGEGGQKAGKKAQPTGSAD